MTPFNFCYWLMGFFELAEPANLSPLQLLLIKEHLSLIPENLLGTSIFCMWLSGYLSAQRDSALNSDQTKMIFFRLRKEFETVIDNSYAPELISALTKLHNGE